MGQCNSTGRHKVPPKHRKKSSLIHRSKTNAGSSAPSDITNSLTIERHGATLTRKGGQGTLKRKERIDEVETEKVRYLLFGSRGTGKTTIFRQVQRAQGKPLKEKFDMRGRILSNFMLNICNVIKVGEQMGIMIDDQSLVEIIKQELQRLVSDIEKLKVYYWPRKVADAIVELHNNSQWQQILAKHRYKTEISDNFDFFMNKLVHDPKYPYFGGPSWIPSHGEFIRAYIESKDKLTLDFEYDEVEYQIMDLGERRIKKVNQIAKSFEAMIFVASLGEYNQQLLENKQVNRLTETVRIWKKVVNDPGNERLWFLVFLNKKDILKDKFFHQEIPVVPDFKVHEPPPTPFEDDEDCVLIMKWFERLFIYKTYEENRGKLRIYFTNALEGEPLNETLNYCSSLLKHNLAMQ